MDLFIESPRIAEVYNIGGGRKNSCSILEAFDLTQEITGVEMIYKYSDENREGDHICYYSDLTKIKRHYPTFSISKDLRDIILDAFSSHKV